LPTLPRPSQALAVPPTSLLAVTVTHREVLKPILIVQQISPSVCNAGVSLLVVTVTVSLKTQTSSVPWERSARTASASLPSPLAVTVILVEVLLLTLLVLLTGLSVLSASAFPLAVTVTPRPPILTAFAPQEKSARTASVRPPSLPGVSATLPPRILMPSVPWNSDVLAANARTALSLAGKASVSHRVKSSTLPLSS